MSHAEIAPSLMCEDMANLKQSVDLFNAEAIPWVHVDVMDGHFVPNLTFGPDFQAKVHAMGSPAIDTHLMITNPGEFIEPFAKAGSRLISAHIEATPHIDRIIGRIKDLGCLAGVATNPATPNSALDLILPHVDVVMMMLVNPGFYGQEMVPYAIEKIADMKARIRGRGLDVRIEVDGNVSTRIIPELVEAGADILVSGTSCLYRKGIPLRDSLRSLKELVASL